MAPCYGYKPLTGERYVITVEQQIEKMKKEHDFGDFCINLEIDEGRKARSRSIANMKARKQREAKAETVEGVISKLNHNQVKRLLSQIKKLG